VPKASTKAQGNLVMRVVEPLIRYLKETRAELRKVTWPTRKEAWNLTLVVVAVTVTMSIILGLADTLFSEIMRGLVVGSWVGIVGAVAVVVAGAALFYFSQGE
jgi:preprotein translocase subunit SecE